MSLVDGVIFLLFVAIYTASFLAGTVRTVAALLSWFVVMVAAAFFTGPLTTALRGLVPAMSRWASELLGFVPVVGIIGLLGIWGSFWSLRAAPFIAGRWRRQQVGPLGLLLQSILAMVFAIAVVASIVMVATHTIQQLPTDALGARLRTEVQRSRLEPIVRDIEPWIQRLTVDWVPGESPSLLGGR
mgnify:FL=1